jgi:hypothetical protein
MTRPPCWTCSYCVRAFGSCPCYIPLDMNMDITESASLCNKNKRTSVTTYCCLQDDHNTFANLSDLPNLTSYRILLLPA